MAPEALQDKNGRSAFRPTKHNAKEPSGTSSWPHNGTKLVLSWPKLESWPHNGAKLVLSWPKLGEVWQGLHFLIGAGAMFGAAFGQDMEKKPKMR